MTTCRVIRCLRGNRALSRPTDLAKSSPFVGDEYVTFPARDLPRTAMGWEVNPEGLRVLLNRLTQDYENLPPLYITENGASYTDVVSDEGTIEDTERAEYILNHLDQVAKSIDDGVDLRGYFVWSVCSIISSGLGAMTSGLELSTSTIKLRNGSLRTAARLTPH